jgi:hypothetical protein
LKANIKKAINGVFQDITIEDDFNYVKQEKEVGIEYSTIVPIILVSQSNQILMRVN